MDVHYYEDGNVRLTTSKNIPESLPKSSHQASGSLVQQIAGWELAYQEELNRGFARLSEGSFKGLRRQLPITRQKVEWEKVGGYRVYFLPPPPFEFCFRALCCRFQWVLRNNDHELTVFFFSKYIVGPRYWRGTKSMKERNLWEGGGEGKEDYLYNPNERD